MAEFEIYSQHLLCLGHGLALYEPDPAGEYDEVRIGDVGHTENGGFHRLFNAFYTEEHEINKLGVPEGFEPLRSELERTYKRSPLPAGAMCSSTVQNQGGGVGATVGPECVSFIQVHPHAIDLFKTSGFLSKPALRYTSHVKIASELL